MASKRRRKEVPGGYLSPGISVPKGPDYVVVELRHDSRIGHARPGFTAPAEAEKPAAALNSVLNAFNVKRVGSHFGMTARQIRRRVVDAPSSHKKPVDAEFAHSGFVQIIPRRSKDAPTLAKRLNRSEAVWKAFVAPRPVPAVAATGSSTASRNFEPAQGYLHSPPNGIGAIEAWHRYNAKGRGVTICDIEGNWNFNHEDLPRIRSLGGDLVSSLDWRNHGTAVLGEMVSRPDRKGTVGISHAAQAAVHSAVVDGVWNTARAIVNAARKLKAGDVILIELQGTGPRGRYVAMQYWLDVFSAIRFAVAKGVTVVEAAGNGNENFQSRIYGGTGLQKDAGAIVVGAGIPPTNYFDYFGSDYGFVPYGSIGVPRSRIWFSNYGDIVSVQAWGWHVATTGYGDAQGGRSENRWYTLRFSGTSSASPIVTGAVACIQSCAMARPRRGRQPTPPLTPLQVRSLLVKTGTPQQPGPEVPVSQHIGPQPDLARALAALARTRIRR